MNKVQENTSNMHLVVIDKISATPVEIMNAMPGATEIYENFKTKALLIRAKNESLTASRIAARIIKTTDKEETVILAINLASCITAYALSIDNTQLVQDMKFSKSTLLRKRDIETADEVQFIISKGIEFLEFLAPYGIKQPQIDQLATSLAKFNNNIPSPRNVINNRKHVAREIKQLFIECRTLLLRLDKLVDILKLTNNDFFTTYFDSRKIINNHGRKLSIRGYIYDSNRNPIESVQVSIAEGNRVTKSTEKGYFEFKNLPAGIQNLNFKRVDFVETNKQVGIIKGQRLTIEVTLENAQNSQDVA